MRFLLTPTRGAGLFGGALVTPDASPFAVVETQVSPSLSQVPHPPSRSSQRTLRARQVLHPTLERALLGVARLEDSLMAGGFVLGKRSEATNRAKERKVRSAGRQSHGGDGCRCNACVLVLLSLPVFGAEIPRSWHWIYKRIRREETTICKTDALSVHQRYQAPPIFKLYTTVHVDPLKAPTPHNGTGSSGRLARGSAIYTLQ